MIGQKKHGYMTLAEHEAKLKSEGRWDEHQAMIKKRSEELARRKVELALAEAPLVEALKVIGLTVGSVWDLVNTSKPYPEAIPILFEHLQKPYPEKVMEGIIRALAVPESLYKWKELLAFFEAAPSQSTGGLRWAAGCALGAAADDDVIEEVIRIVRDARYGSDRVALLPALVRSHDARAKMLLHELRTDPILAKEVKKLRRINRK